MGGGAGGNVGGVAPAIFGGAEFMQGVFTAIEQVVTGALDTILVTEEELRVLFASYQLQGDALQWWKTVEESVAKKWEPFRKAFLDQYFTNTAKEALRREFINLVQGSMTVAQYEAKFTSLSRFAKAFVSTEEEKAKQFMRGLRPSIRNKSAGNLIKIYSTMVSAVAAIEETLNETRKITNPKSQCKGTSNQSEGRFSKKSKNSTSQQQQHPTRSSPITSVASIVHTEEEQSGSYRIATTYSVSPGLEDCSSIYISTDFISVWITGYGSVGSEDSGAGLCYDISSETVGDSRAAGAAVGYLCRTRYVSCV
ncbi:hypothetical protein Acr_00g0082090 [Actinidia rufa]|uniref:Retrotransposon gag domain-containing protein n=1 Tax=Actinidia rufa TaxID=165716 RepID=A0A7J0DUJ1_9ERIC|nr:hypothetical protein Acr_00g0082090 [Actinidia rufa]